MLISIGRTGRRWVARVYDRGPRRRPVLRAIVRGSLGYVTSNAYAFRAEWGEPAPDAVPRRPSPRQ